VLPSHFHRQLDAMNRGRKAGNKQSLFGPGKNFFSLTKDHIEKTGSAKELSMARAEVIKDWLVAQGIAEDRIEAIGWGGSKPLYDRKGPNARKNARVELEVIQ